MCRFAHPHAEPPTQQSGAIAALCNKSAPPKTNKNFPKSTALNIPTTLIFRCYRRERPVLSSRASYPPIGRDSRTSQQIHTSPNQQKLPPRAPALNKANKIFTLQGRVLLGEVLGGSGRFGGRGDPLSRGSPLPPRSYPRISSARACTCAELSVLRAERTRTTVSVKDRSLQDSNRERITFAASGAQLPFSIKPIRRERKLRSTRPER